MARYSMSHAQITFQCAELPHDELLNVLRVDRLLSGMGVDVVALLGKASQQVNSTGLFS